MSRFLGKMVNSMKKDSRKLFSAKREVVGIHGKHSSRRRKQKQKRK